MTRVNSLILVFIITILYSCKSAIKKIEIIDSRANFPSIISQNIFKNEDDIFNESEFLENIKNELLINKTCLVDYNLKPFIDKINFKNFNDTILLADLNIKSPTGGIPLVYTYNVKENDVIFYNLNNDSGNKLISFQISEGSFPRFIKENLRRKDKINSSFVVTSDNTLTVQISNDNPLKNLGLFKSKLRVKLKKLSNVSVKSEIYNDTTWVTKKIVETNFDTIYNVEANNKFKLSSSLNINSPSKLSIPVIIKKNNDSLISWAYWIGLNSKDTLRFDDSKTNPLSLLALNELNNSRLDSKISQQLYSDNNDIEINFENYTIDRRTLNFKDNFSVYFVDNNFSLDLEKKAQISLLNRSTLNDFDVQLAITSISLSPVKIEVEKEVGEIKKYIKLTLIGN
tara:strand:+ start:3617 stop:4813 length:1197 start_codon:yes stop_codon:yes gene_type:complete